MRLLDQLRGVGSPSAAPRDRSSFGPYSWPTPAVSFNGIGYGPHELLHQTTTGKTESIEANFQGILDAVKQVPPAFAAQNVRSLLLSQVRFTFRNVRTRSTFGTSALGALERPAPKVTTGELVSKMEWHEGLAGNAYVHRDRLGVLRNLRPDWTTIVLGSEQDPDDAINQLDAHLVGYIYKPGGYGSKARAVTLMPEDVAHWSPLPDPAATFRGMSWLTPAIRELQGDMAMASHKLQFFRNGATPNLVINGIPAPSAEEFERLVDKMEEGHAGLSNAYKTLYLAAGADATVVGSDLKQIDFKSTMGTGENRIAVLSRVPAPVLGISEGLAGSSLNAGNYGQARRNLADGWMTPTLQSLCGALSELVDVPADAELWYTTEDMPFVREDARDAAEIEQLKAITIRQLVDGGFDPASVIAAVEAQDMTLLVHTGLLSVQLQEPGAVPASERRTARAVFDEFGRVVGVES